MSKTLTILPATVPWFVDLRFAYYEKFKEVVKSVPGAHWNADAKTWGFPIEMLPPLIQTARQMGFTVQNSLPAPQKLKTAADLVDIENLYKYQQDAVVRSINEWRHIVSFETGLGKTVTALAVIRQFPPTLRVLIVCPALIRQVWLNEFVKWKVPRTPASIQYGTDRKLTKSQAAERAATRMNNTQIVSYNLLEEVVDDRWQIIVFDEMHMLKAQSAARTRLAQTLVNNNSSALIIGLTATLAADKPEDCHVLDVIWPGRFGSRARFQRRYQNPVSNSYRPSGFDYVGVNPITAPELAVRVAECASRVTKQSVAHLLPAFLVQTLVVQTETQKLVACIAGAEEATIAVLTFYRAQAKLLAAELGTPYLITGELPPEKRHAIIAEVKEKGGILVATMSSVGQGVDLTFCQQAFFYELPYALEIMIQALGRFSRLSGTAPTQCTLLVQENTPDEVVANLLFEKVVNINTIVAIGATDAKLQAALKPDENAWRKDLQNAGIVVNEELLEVLE